MERHFCTYFDHRYLTRGLALRESMRASCPDGVLWVLCLDDRCHEALSKLALPGMRLLRLQELEEAYPDLLATKANRTLMEYYFTCSPFLPLHILREHADVPLVTYLDADMFFFSSPEPVFASTEQASVVLTPHRFLKKDDIAEKYGIFNVGWIGFRNDARALACLEGWRARCVEWCYNRLEPGRYADQKYLDEWPHQYQGVQVLNDPGVNAAAWNLGRVRLEGKDRHVFVDGARLVCYHFHALKLHNSWLVETDLSVWGLALNRSLKRGIYLPYLRSLARQERLLKTAGIHGIHNIAPSLVERGAPRGLRRWREYLSVIRRHQCMLGFYKTHE